MPIPCVLGNVDGLSVFQATADQRFELGESLFLDTHLPVRFWARHAGTNTMWTESELLNTLLQNPTTLKGNRVFVLFGAAGAGKSEVMRWVLSQVGCSDPARSRFTVRIARTELDPVRITARILEQFELPGLGQDVLHRWDELQRKPVALANQLVWQALSGQFETDEEILPLSFRLRPVVEANLRAGFAAMTEPGVADRPLQLVTREQLEQVLADTVLDIEPVYEHLRARLQGALEQHAQGGVGLINSLRTISRQVRKQHGLRPLLIVDDLVQSLNVYASDLLDYLITLEEGEWDVVLGLTPAAFEWDRRGRELLLRIKELDTVDDRVVKLDLSDTTGDASSFLTEESAAAFLMPYLQQYKQVAGFTCNKGCPHWNQCSSFQWGQERGATLSPLNEVFVTRIWRRLPSGKGRARYLLLAARRALELMATSGANSLPDLVTLVDRDLYVNSDDERVRALLECFHPATEGAVADVPASLALSFGLPIDVASQVTPLCNQRALRTPPHPASPVELVSPEQVADPVRLAVRDWLEGRVPNRELLKPLRGGLARLLRDVVDPTLLIGAEFAQPNGALRWSEVRDGVTIPISLEEADEPGGIPVSRALAADAFDLVDYADAKGHSKVGLINKFLERPLVPTLFFQAEELRTRWRTQLEEALGCSVPELGFHLYRVALAFGARLPAPLTLAHEATGPLNGLEWPGELVRAVKLLWEDCFRIRENLYNGHCLVRFQGCWPEVGDSLLILKPVLEASVPDAFRLGEQPVSQVLATFREHLQRIQTALDSANDQRVEWEAVLDLWERLVDGRRRGAVERRWNELVEATQGLLMVPPIPSLPAATEAKGVLQLIQTLRACNGKVTTAERYRYVASNERMLTCSWVRHVQQWHDQLRGVYFQARTFSRQAGADAPIQSPPQFVTELLDQTTALLVEGARHRAITAQMDALRQVTESDSGRFALRLASLLILVVPERFEVAQRYSGQRDECEAFLRAWKSAVNCLAQNAEGAEPAALLLPPASSLARWQETIRSACAWWSAFARQLPLVMRPTPRSATQDLTEFLGAVADFVPPAEAAVLRWHRFLATAQRWGTTNLPIHTLLDQPDIPVEMQRWLHALVAAEATGVSLADLAPHVLAELRGRFPELTQSLRVSMIPEGDSDGVLCFLDGQRSRVSDL